MAFRKIKAKKYNGIHEYYNPKSVNKETKALYVAYRDEFGKPTKKKLDTLDRDEALEQLNILKANITKGRKRIQKEESDGKRAFVLKRLTLKQVTDMYFEQRRSKYNTEDKQRFEKRVIPFLGDKLANRITTENVQELQDKLVELDYAPKTVNETINSLRALYNVAVRKKWVDQNPVDRHEIRKLEENHEPGVVLNDKQLEVMFDAFKNGLPEHGLMPNETLYFFAKLLYYTGARPAAVMSLQLQHIDFTLNRIHLKAMKLGKSYQQPVNQKVMEMIQDWIEKHKLRHGDYLFYPQQLFENSDDLSVKRSPMNYSVLRKAAQNFFDKLFNEGIPTDAVMDRVTLYTLRRTSGTKIYKAKGIMQAMLFLNHTNVTTTQRYLNVKGDIEDLIDVL